MSRPALTIGAIAIALVQNVFVPAPSAAQDWPTRPVTMVVPFAAGGASDVIGRILSPHLSEILGQQVIIENIGGAGGMIGAHAWRRRRPTAISSCSATPAPMPRTRRSTKPALQCRDRFRAGRADRRSAAGADRAQGFARQ